MATVIGLPKLSPTMEEGVLAKWIKKEGDHVAPGEVIAEVETDKANMEFSLEDEGTLLVRIAEEGQTVKLGAPVAILGEPGEDVSALVEAAKAAPGPSPVPGPSPIPGPEPGPGPTPAPAREPGAKLLASPLAKTLAAEHGIDLRTLTGSGPGGRIVERDVRAVLDQAGGEAAHPAVGESAGGGATSSQPPSGGAPRGFAERGGGEGSQPPFRDTALSPMRRTIARRLTQAKQSIPHFYVTSTCDARPLVAFRSALHAVDPETKVSINDLAVKAAALALRRIPEANAAFLEDRIRVFSGIHIGVAVAIPDGLVTTVVRDADQKGLATIAAETRDLAERARARHLRPEEMTGSTFTVSNLGMFGVDHFAAIINPPEAAILAVGAVKDQPVVDGDRVIPGQRMALTLSCDHRVVDGALGARLLAELTTILLHPAALAL